jgi:hypothetical protein
MEASELERTYWTTSHGRNEFRDSFFYSPYIG